MDALNQLASGWATWLVAVTWQLAALALLAFMCEKVFRLRTARVRYALWWFVLVAPLVLAPGRMMLERCERWGMGATLVVTPTLVSESKGRD